MAQFKLTIVTPDRKFYEGDVEMLIATGVEGEFAILKGHTPFVTLLKTGKVLVKARGEEKLAAIAEGFITVKEDVVKVVSDACEWVEEIDVLRAQKAKERAKMLIDTAKDDEAREKAKQALERAINRIKLGQNK